MIFQLPCRPFWNVCHNFRIAHCGTISATLRMVGANGLGFLAGLTCNAFRWASVPGNALMRGIPLSGGRSGNNSPSSRRESHSVKVGNSIMVCSRTECENKRNTQSRYDEAGVMEPSFNVFSFGTGNYNVCNTNGGNTVVSKERTRPALFEKPIATPTKTRKA